MPIDILEAPDLLHVVTDLALSKAIGVFDALTASHKQLASNRTFRMGAMRNVVTVGNGLLAFPHSSTSVGDPSDASLP